MKRKSQAAQIIVKETKQKEIRRINVAEGDLVLIVRNKRLFRWEGKGDEREYAPVDTRTSYILGVFQKCEIQSSTRAQKRIYLKDCLLLKQLKMGGVALPSFVDYYDDTSASVRAIEEGKDQLYVEQEIPDQLRIFGLDIHAGIVERMKRPYKKKN